MPKVRRKQKQYVVSVTSTSGLQTKRIATQNKMVKYWRQNEKAKFSTDKGDNDQSDTPFTLIRNIRQMRKAVGTIAKKGTMGGSIENEIAKCLINSFCPLEF